MKKALGSISISFGLMTCFISCEPNQTASCPSQELSQSQKSRNLLFLTFYSGMTPDEFSNEENKLIKDGTLYHSDSTTHFQLVVKNIANTGNPSDTADECLFTLTPSFDQCALNSISLHYVPINNYLASFKTFEMGSQKFREQKIPYESTVKAVKKLYDEKYGKSVAGGKISPVFGGQRWYTWISNNNEVTFYEDYGIAQDYTNQKDYNLLSGFSIEYMNRDYINKNQARIDSADKNRAKESQKQIEAGKKII